MTDDILRLFKFGKKEHIEQLYREGLLYLNTLDYFTRLEGDGVRGDKDEGLSMSLQPEIAKLQIKIGETYEPVRDIIGPIKFRDGRNDGVNVRRHAN